MLAKLGRGRRRLSAINLEAIEETVAKQVEPFTTIDFTLPSINQPTQSTMREPNHHATQYDNSHIDALAETVRSQWHGALRMIPQFGLTCIPCSDSPSLTLVMSAMPLSSSLTAHRRSKRPRGRLRKKSRRGSEKQQWRRASLCQPTTMTMLGRRRRGKNTRYRW